MATQSRYGDVISVEAILTLAGRLEDEPGFDAPRQRFRRFLLEQVTDVATLRSLIASCQHAPGDQHRRALRDLIVVAGRFLGFEAAFGTYQTAPDRPKDDGVWRSRPRLQVVLDVRVDPADSGVDALSRAVAEAVAAPRADRTCALCVAAPLLAGGSQIAHAAAAARLAVPVTVASIETLLSLAAMVQAGRVTHDDVVRVLENGMPIEFVIELLDRAAARPPRSHEAPTPAVFMPPVAAPAADDGPSCWMATVGGDLDAAPEEFLRLVVGGRHLLGVPETGAPAPVVRAGDAICFHIPGRGIVGHARVQALASGSQTPIRAAHRFRQFLQLDEPVLHLDAPIPLDADTQRRLRATSSRSARHASTLIKISPDSYAKLTAVDVVRTLRSGAG